MSRRTIVYNGIPREIVSWVFDKYGNEVLRTEQGELFVVLAKGSPITAASVELWYWTYVGSGHPKEVR